MYNVIPLNRSLPFQMKQELLDKIKAGHSKKKVFLELAMVNGEKTGSEPLW